MVAAAVDAEFALMLLADARLPSGSHTQSAGLEAALMGGMAESAVPAYLTTRLRTYALVDSGTAVVAREALCDNDIDVVQQLSAVQLEWAARTPSHVQRAAAAELGRGYLRLLRSVSPDSPGTHAVGSLSAPPRPIVLAALAATLGLDSSQLVRLVCYDEVQSITSAALKLAPLDPTATVAWALETRSVVQDVVGQVAGLRDPAEIPAPTAPLMEIWAHTHAHQTRRLFRA